MDLLNTKELYYNNKPHTHAFYGGVLVWSKEKGEFSKDFKDLTDFEEWGGIYIPEKGGLLIEGEL